MTWPHLVWKELQQSFPEVKFDYLNAAFPGYSVLELLITLEHRVKPLSPDVIVIYHATNDLSYITRKLAEAHGIFLEKSKILVDLASGPWPGFLSKKILS